MTQARLHRYCCRTLVGIVLIAPLATPGGCARAQSAAEGDIARVESGLDLPGLMKAHGIPGLSVAVIEDYKIAWAKGYGVTEKGGTSPVTDRTLFMAGSISKPVTAVGAMVLVQHGKLSLERDVNQTLSHWKLPESSSIANGKVTVSSILDHTSGIRGGDFFPGYAVGSAVPTLLQILDGTPPAANGPIRVSAPPNAQWRYSGNAYLVLQQVMVDAVGQPFPELMRRLVFEPLGMRDTSFAPPRAAMAASGTLLNGNAVAGKWHVQPELAAGGLWTTPSDLAKLAIELALAADGKSQRILSEHYARDMLSPHWSKDVINILGTAQSPDRMGYGFFVGDGGRFGHIGGNVGYQATMVMFSESGHGAVIMTNSDIGLQAGNALLNRIASMHGWNYTTPPPP